MSESKSISTNVSDLDRSNVYRNQIDASSCCAAVMACELPTLHKQPADWISLQVDIAQMKAATLAWAEAFFPLVVAAPELVIASDKSITETVKQAIEDVVALQVDPGNSSAHSALLSALQKLSGILEDLEKAVSASGTDLTHLYDTLQTENAAHQFGNAVTETMKLLNVSAESFSQLDEEVSNYYSSAPTIAEDNLPASGSVQSILADLPILVDWPAGKSNWLPYYAAAMTSDTALNPSSSKLPGVTVPADLEGNDADMAALSEMSNLFSACGDHTTKVTQYRAELNVGLNGALEVAGAALAETRKLAEEEKWQDTKVALEAFVTGWAVLNNLVTEMHFTVQVSDALLTPDMDGREVKQAVENGTNQPILEFIKQQAAS